MRIELKRMHYTSHRDVQLPLDSTHAHLLHAHLCRPPLIRLINLYWQQKVTAQLLPEWARKKNSASFINPLRIQHMNIKTQMSLYNLNFSGPGANTSLRSTRRCTLCFSHGREGPRNSHTFLLRRGAKTIFVPLYSTGVTPGSEFRLKKFLPNSYLLFWILPRLIIVHTTEIDFSE